MNTPVPIPHTITSYYSTPTLLSQVSNPAAERSPVSENYCIEANNDGATETVQWDEEGKYPYSAVGPEIENNGTESNNDGATETVHWDEGVKYPSYAVCGISERLTIESLD